MTGNRLASSAVVIIDLVLIHVAFFASYVIRYMLHWPYPVDPRYSAPYTPYIPYAIALGFMCLIAYRANGLYERRRGTRWLDEAYKLFNGTTASILLVMAVTFAIQPSVYSRGMLILADFLIVGLLSAARLVERLALSLLRRRGIGVEHVLIVGAGEVGRAVMRTMLADPGLGYRVVGYIDDDPIKGSSELGRFKGLGSLDRLTSILSSEQVNEVIITLPWMYHRKIMQIVDECDRQHMKVRVVPDVFQQKMQHIDLDTLNGIPLIGVERRTLSTTALVIKRAVELTLIILSAPVWMLVFGLVALLIRLDSPGPVFFKHRRVGKDGHEFDMYKFRSMVKNADEQQAALAELNEADGPLFKIKNDPRLTRVGKFLRRTSIDELPQLFNVIRGEMSLIGPRPGTPEELTQYEPWQRARILVKPGLSGLWQVSGRSDIPFEEMCLLDIYYIENWSLGLDIRIVLQTIPYALLGRGAY